jgi:mono/diheme cytochrome c family protein
MRKLTDLVTLIAILGLPVLLAFTLPLLAPQAARAADAGAMPGKEVFVAQKCSLCHSIDSQAIERKSKSEKTKGPDLSEIGKDHDAAWITKWLKKEVADENGKKHEKDFKGTPEEMQKVAEFLASLKSK